MYKFKPEVPETPAKHGIISGESLTLIQCKCGFTWRNDELKGKSDADLKIEMNVAWLKHLEESK